MLDIGGEKIVVRIETLLPSTVFREQLENGAREGIFIDEDYKVFRHVINLLRNPNAYPFPSNYLFLLDKYGISYNKEEEPEPPKPEPIKEEPPKPAVVADDSGSDDYEETDDESSDEEQTRETPAEPSAPRFPDQMRGAIRGFLGHSDTDPAFALRFEPARIDMTAPRRAPIIEDDTFEAQTEIGWTRPKK